MRVFGTVQLWCAASTTECDFNSLTTLIRTLFRYRNEQLPDPVRLVRRIHALELAAQQLQNECADLSSRRKQVVQNAVQATEENQKLLSQVRA